MTFQKHTYFQFTLLEILAGMHYCETLVCMFSFCQWSLTEKTHTEVKIWLMETRKVLSISEFMKHTEQVCTHTKSKRPAQCFCVHLKIPITTKSKNTQENWLGKTVHSYCSWIPTFEITHMCEQLEKHKWGREQNHNHLSFVIPV